MNAKEYIDKVGIDSARKVAEQAGTNYTYLSQIAYGHRRPSVDLASRLELASGGEMDFVSLLQQPRRESAA